MGVFQITVGWRQVLFQFPPLSTRAPASQASSFRAVRVCFEIGDRLPYDGISSEWFTSKPASQIV